MSVSPVPSELDTGVGGAPIRMAGPGRPPRRAALAHQCRSCRQPWALHMVQGPAGQLILCRYCGAPRGVQPCEEEFVEALAGVLDMVATRPLPVGRGVAGEWFDRTIRRGPSSSSRSARSP